LVTTHLCYEEGDADAACAFLAFWLTTYPRNGTLYSHLSWHLALGHLEAGDAATALRLFTDTFAPDAHSGPPRGNLNDAVSFLWRAGNWLGIPVTQRLGVCCTISRPAPFRAPALPFPTRISHLQRPWPAMGPLWGHANGRSTSPRNGRYPTGPLVPAVSRAFAAFEPRGLSAAIDALEPVAGELERIGGGRARLDLVEFTLLKAYLGADRQDDARRMLGGRRRGSTRTSIAGLAAVH
jgi:hypothetical protein